MTKELLLAKSHFRKNKGTTVGIFLLMLIAASLLSISMILFTDVYPTAQTSAKKLDSGDGVIKIYNIGEKNEEFIKDLMGDDVVRYSTSYCLNYDSESVLSNTNGAEVLINVLIENTDEAFNKDIARTEVVSEDPSITDNYIYLPYQFHSSGKFEIGDTYELRLTVKKYDLKIKGFLENTYYGCNNSGCYEMIVSDNIYDELMELSGDTNYCAAIPYELKDGVKQSRFATRVSNDVIAHDYSMTAENVALNDVIMSRTFMSLIIAVSFLTVNIIVMAVITMMIANSISNYVKENMKTIGALKAIGYTGKNIKASLLLMFLEIAVIASLIGVALSYAALPIVANVVVAQMGLPFTASFSLISSIAAFALVIVLTLIATLISVRKINKIVPIVALREGVESHNFKRNPIKLERSVLGLDMSLAMKTLFSNLRQNVITFVVTAFLIFLCVIALLMFENFNRNPNLKLMALEICSGTIGVSDENTDEAYEFLSSRSEVKNIRKSYIFRASTNEEDIFLINAFEDPTKMDNTDVCYKGRLPSHDNELCISGKYAKNNDLDIGDEIEFELADKTYTYIITGLIQTTNNGGREAIMNEAAARNLAELDNYVALYYFDTDTEEQTVKLLEDAEVKLGDHLVNSNNFYHNVEGSLSTFKGIATLMLVVVCTISGAVILLVLYLLIRSLIFSKRRDYGIYKAIGYTSGSLVFQTAASFMPSIIVSTILGSVASYFLANPYMQMIMINFGLMKCTFTIPIPGVIIIAASMIVVSFLFAVFESRRVKKIEAYNMLVAE
ncbi:MAG: ABC transporter permease [Clostridia bacterium]|nr:ABC transporter permease [Clostridia bacterium]